MVHTVKNNLKCCIFGKQLNVEAKSERRVVNNEVGMEKYVKFAGIDQGTKINQ
jgi:hypothetical protein